MHPWLVYGDRLQLPTYFTCLMIGFALSSFVLRREATVRGLPPRKVMDLALWALPTVLIGARLAHVVLEAPRFYWENPVEVLRIAYGGFVFYGGLLAGGILLFRYARAHALSPWLLGDVFAPATAFGLAFGRLGCLGGGCCYGRPADWPLGVAVPWGIRYYRRGHVPDPLLATSLHPAPLYEIVGVLALFVALSRLRPRARAEGEVLLAFLAGYGLLRAGVEVFRADAERGLWLGGWLSTSQIIGLGSAAIALALWRARRAGAPVAGGPG